MASSSTSAVREDKASGVWNRVLRAALALPGAKIDRDSFLYAQLSSHCGKEQVQRAIETRPADAGVPSDVIDRIADSCIKRHVLGASSISFVTGVPGGLAIAATIPADLAQFYWHAIVVAQKLAYLYGWPDLTDGGEVDEQTELQLTLFIGTMMGAGVAQRGIAELAERLARQVAHRLPRQPLTKYAVYNLAKQAGRWIGVNLTKATFSRGIAKAIPVLGGAISATATAGMMWPMAKRLQRHLKALRYARPD